MFDHHKKSPWFVEKYEPTPDLENLRKRVRKEGWKGRLDNFLVDLELGKFDPEVNEAEPEPPSPTKDAGEVLHIESGDVTGDESKPTDDDIQDNVEGDDDEPARLDANGKSSSDKKTINYDEEMSVPPEGNQVMIRTIPPDIGRIKLEEVRRLSELFRIIADPVQSS